MPTTAGREPSPFGTWYRFASKRRPRRPEGLGAAECGAFGGASTYIWTAWDGSFADLGAVQLRQESLRRNTFRKPYAVSDDGSVVGGDTGRTEKLAMIWTPDTGMMYVSDF